MHSRIFQISKKPIDIEDYIDASNYYDHWFTNSVADYVNGDTVRENDIDWLKACYKDSGLSFGKDDYNQYFIVEDKMKYFAAKFERFQNILKELATITLEGFTNGKYDLQMYSLKEAYDDKFGFYIDSDDTYLVTFDEFIRYADVGAKYYIGATIDYHF